MLDVWVSVVAEMKHAQYRPNPGCRPGCRRGCRPVADKFELSRHIARTWSQTGSQQAFDRPAIRTLHAHAGLDPGRRPGLRLDNVMEFGLMPVCLACVVI